MIFKDVIIEEKLYNGLSDEFDDRLNCSGKEDRTDR
jgi:hypothetical protein